jgi:hypothetical protein
MDYWSLVLMYCHFQSRPAPLTYSAVHSHPIATGATAARSCRKGLYGNLHPVCLPVTLMNHAVAPNLCCHPGSIPAFAEALETMLVVFFGPANGWSPSFVKS